MASQYLNQFDTKEEMNSAYASGHSDEWVAYCAEDNNIYYNTNLTGNSKYFDDLEYNSENKTLDFYIDNRVKKSIDVSPWWFEKNEYYTKEEINTKFSAITSAETATISYGVRCNNDDGIIQLMDDREGGPLSIVYRSTKDFGTPPYYLQFNWYNSWYGLGINRSTAIYDDGFGIWYKSHNATEATQAFKFDKDGSFYIGDTSINETQLQKLLALI